MIDTLIASLDQSEPPESLTPPLQALWWLKKGDLKLSAEWEHGHNICQAGHGKAIDWVHALAHWIEGDMGNSAYWYRRADETRTGENTSEEWSHIASKVSG